MLTRVLLLTFAMTLMGGLSGCQWFPSAARPSNWWKLNGQDPGGRDSMYFSVPDPPRPDKPGQGVARPTVPNDNDSAL